MRIFLIVFCLVGLSSHSAWAQNKHPSTIYDADSRAEVVEVNDEALQDLARSTVALVQKKDILRDAQGQPSILGEPFGLTYQMCKSERFYEQKMYGFCSGVLVAPDRVLTAGHCFETLTECADTVIAVDLKLKSPKDLNISVQDHQLRRCKSILKHKMIDGGLDYALIELDHPITDREPIPLAKPLRRPKDIFMIGYPFGLAEKFSGQGRTVRNDPLSWLTRLNSSMGSSGSPVFNGKTHELLGILTEGEEDFIDMPEGCKISRFCRGNECRGETVLKIEAILNDL